MSLSELRKVEERGVTFLHLDGAMVEPPERAIEIQTCSAPTS